MDIRTSKHVYTAGTSYNEDEILDKSINIIKTNRGGKSHISWTRSNYLLFCY